VIPFLTDQGILVGKVGVSWVLIVWINPSVSNGNSLEVKFQVLSLVYQVVGNCGDVVTSIAFTSDVEISADIFWVLDQETLDEKIHVCSNLLFSLVQVTDLCSFTVSGANWVVNEGDVAHSVPGVFPAAERKIFWVDLESTVFKEYGNFG